VANQLPLPLETGPALGRGDFITGPGNAEAVAFVDLYPNWTAPAAALYGPQGSGKSHLVAIWAAKSGAQTVEAKALAALLADPSSSSPVAVENVDEESTAELDHALFALLNRGSPLLLTARRHPAQWPVQLPDLRSRLEAMLAFPMWVPDDALLGRLARKLFSDRQLQVSDAVVHQIIVALERSPAALRAFVARADAKALAEKKPITLALVRNLLSLTP
jgi:chromosomal replication initiation ATPase DnaA